MTDTKTKPGYPDIVSRATTAAAIFAPAVGEEFFLAHLVDGRILEADLCEANLKAFLFHGIVALIDDQVVCKMDSKNIFLAARASEHFTKGLKSLPAPELARLELERLAKLEDTRS